MQFGKRLAAYVVPAPEAESPSDEELRAHIRAQLARHKVPREIRFVTEIPRTSTGKIRRRELAKRFESETAEIAERTQ